MLLLTIVSLHYFDLWELHMILLSGVAGGF